MKTIYCVRVIDYDSIRSFYEYGSAFGLICKYTKLGYFVLDVSPVMIRGFYNE